MGTLEKHRAVVRIFFLRARRDSAAADYLCDDVAAGALISGRRAALKRTHSRCCANARLLRTPRSAWSARALAPLFPSLRARPPNLLAAGRISAMSNS